MNTSSALARFTITLSTAVTESVQVEWHTSDGTAKATVDYAANKGVVVFEPGETAKVVDILVYGRAVGTEDRSFFVEMLPPTNAILGASIGECIIHVDTSGSTPVTEIIIPTGPQGIQGKSAYQSYLDTTTDNPPMTEPEWVESLKGDPEEIAQEVAPLIDVGATTLVAEGTETLGKPDATTVKAVARRVAYAAATKIATVILADGDNSVSQADMTGDTLDLNSSDLVMRIVRGGSVITPTWSIQFDGKILVKSAVAGDVLYASQYDFTPTTRAVTNTREVWRRAMAEAGLTLVDGSFEMGATATSKTDAVWHEAGCQCYTWDGSFNKTVAPLSTPANTGGVGAGAWVSTAVVSLRGALIAEGSQQLVDDSRVRVRQPFPSSIIRSQHDKNLETVSAMDFGAIGDGTVHPLSEFYSSLSDAQVVYPFVTSLSQSIDYAAFQAAINSGLFWVIAPRDKRYTFCITDSLRISKNNTSIDLNGSELKMVDPTGLKSHIVIQSENNTQIQGNFIRNTTLINEHASTVYQVKTFFTGGLWITHCIGYSPSYGHVGGFVDLGNAIACHMLNCITERMKDSSVNIHGSGVGANSTIDVMIYDCRFTDGDYGIKVGDYSEGMFFRRTFTYAQRIACIGFIPSSKAAALGSIKLQEIDFDSPNLTGSFLFMRYVRNVQVTGSWFSGPVTGAMIRLEETDGVLIEAAQAYPVDAFLLDNGVGTTVVNNQIVGGTVICQFGPLADETLIQGNNIRGAVSAVAADQHKKTLSVISNKFKTSSAAITVNTTNPELHTYEGNTGDNGRGVTTSSFIPGSPYVSTTGARPENISFRKASAISSIVVNDVEVYNSVDGVAPAFVGLGMLPPHTKFSVVFNTANTPWLNRVKC